MYIISTYSSTLESVNNILQGKKQYLLSVKNHISILDTLLKMFRNHRNNADIIFLNINNTTQTFDIKLKFSRISFSKRKELIFPSKQLKIILERFYTKYFIKKYILYKLFSTFLIYEYFYNIKFVKVEQCLLFSLLRDKQMTPFFSVKFKKVLPQVAETSIKFDADR